MRAHGRLPALLLSLRVPAQTRGSQPCPDSDPGHPRKQMASRWCSRTAAGRRSRTRSTREGTHENRRRHIRRNQAARRHLHPRFRGLPRVCQRGPVVGRRVLPRPCGGGRRRADDQRTVHQRDPVLGLAASRRPGHGQRRRRRRLRSGSTWSTRARYRPAWPLRTAWAPAWRSSPSSPTSPAPTALTGGSGCAPRTARGEPRKARAGRHAAGQQPADEPWARTSDRSTWRAYKGGLVLTVTRVADGSGWTATVESPNVTEQSPAPLPTRLAAQQWADSRAGGAR